MYVPLFNEETNEYEHFLVHNDIDVGFDSILQESIKETVSLKINIRALMTIVRQMTSK